MEDGAFRVNFALDPVVNRINTDKYREKEVNFTTLQHLAESSDKKMVS